MDFLQKNPPRKKEDLRAHHGEVQHSFLAPEFLDYPRGPVWYLVAGTIALGILTFGILTHALTLTFAFLLFVAVYWLLHHREARMIKVTFTRCGIHYNHEFFAFDEIKEFWIVHKPPFVADLKLHVQRKLHPILTIHIFGQDPFTLRALLSTHVTEIKDREEHFVDLLARALRL